ncbi:N-alpha-acetyltransferase 16, NatA auxiliary subunit [Dirofilaria immitis]|nr:N-alpha-acetyltransferase 16, NatA auxiliary subunit [Dirofilaria immitis]
MAPPGQSSSQPLPSKELTLFRKVVKHYEHKQYKNGLRCAKMILSNPQFNEHGETLAMKGLILNCMGKHEEAQECVKRGLKADLRSHVCWHVFGLIQRSEKKYDEAMKAYKQALRLDRDNMQILRDLSLLQIQMRDLDGYRDSRYRLLMLRPQQRIAWIGYATAYHLLKDYDMALKIVSEFCNSNRVELPEYDFEQSELILYQNMILRESGQLELALNKLEENASQLLIASLIWRRVLKDLGHNKSLTMWFLADLLMALNDNAKAEMTYWKLIERNPENIIYYHQIEKCRGLAENDIEGRYEVYKKAILMNSHAAIPKRVPLYFLHGAQFESLLFNYLITGLRKGVPSLFKYLIPLYVDTNKQLKDVVDNPLPESPTTVLWLYYLLAQHYDKLGSVQQALVYIDRAIQHTPTLIELYMIKAKIHKHAGNAHEGASLMEQAQSLDTADRYVNSKCAKYLLRAGLIKEAENMCSKFTREGVNASANLNEMQCMWYEIECAKAHQRLENYGEALKNAMKWKGFHFLGIIEDQFDFHTYCIRKMTLCSYIGLLRLEDVLRRHKFYYEAARIAITIYLRMYDHPNDFTPDKHNGEVDLSASELKKLKKTKKVKAKEALEAAAKQKQTNVKKGDVEIDGFAPEPLDAEKLLKVDDPLEEASKFVQPLLQLNSEQFGSYILGFEVYYRKKKVLLMLQCLNKATKLQPNSPDLHVAACKYLHYYEKAQLEGTVKELAAELTGILFPDTKSASEFNTAFKSANINSLPHRFAVAEVSIFLDLDCADVTKNWLLCSLDDNKLTGVTLKNIEAFYNGILYGKYGNWSANEMAQLTKRCHLLFKDATLFGGGVNLGAEEKENCNIKQF